jgi:hypothetical protein
MYVYMYLFVFDVLQTSLSIYTDSKTESMFHLVSFHTPYFENEWANSKWVNTRVVVSKVYYNHKKTWSKKQLQFGSKW